jgi:hypothetical protein
MSIGVNGLIDGSSLTIATGGIGSSTISNVGASANAKSPYVRNVDIWMEEHDMNKVVVDYKLSEQEFLRMRETNADYASEIKQTITSQLTSAVSQKASFTKRYDKDADVHHFIGRVWVFTDEELKSFLHGAP